MVPSAQATEVGQSLDWRRPHPLTIVVEIGHAVRSVMFAGAAVWVGLLGSGASASLTESSFELVVVALPLVTALARWYTTRYALDTESVHLHYGLIWRRRQVLPRSNVQNVSTKAGIVARLGSVVELQVSDASATGDITIRFVSRDEADRLTTLLRSSIASRDGAPPAGNDDQSDHDDDSRPGLAAPPPGPASLPVDREALVSPTIRELVVLEATTVSVLVLAAAAVLVGAGGALVLALDLFDLPVAATASWLALTGIVAAALVIDVVSVASAVLVVGGYRLTAEPDRLRIQGGLLTEARVAARRERIQQLRVRRDVGHRYLGRERVEFETADVEISGTPATRYLSPAGRAGDWRDLAVEVFGQVQVDEPDLRPVSPLTKRRMMMRFAVGSLPLLALGLLRPLLPLPLIAAVMGAGWWYSRRRYAELGWATSDDQLLVRAGVVFGRLTLVRLDKVQILRLSATVFQRRLDLVTLRLSTAGRGFTGLVLLPDLPRSTGEELLDQLARRAAATPVSQTL